MQPSGRPSTPGASAPSHESPAVWSEQSAVWFTRDRELLELRRRDPQASLTAAQRWLAEAPPGSEEEAWATRAHADTLRSIDDCTGALAGYMRAETHFSRLGLDREVARTGTNHAWVLRLLGRYDEALHLGLRTRRFFRLRGDALETARVNLNLGPVYRRIGRLETARRAYVEAARDFRRCGDLALEVTAVSNLGNVLADLGRFGEAETAQRRAVRLYGQLGQQAQEARARVNLGLLLKRRGDYGSALKFLQEGRSLNAQLQLSSGVAEADLFLVQTYLAVNLQEEAAEASRRAIAGFSRLDLPFELGQALLWAAAAAERRGTRQEASNYLAESANRFRHIGNPLWEAIATVLAASMAQPDEATLDNLAAAERRLARLGARDRASEAKLARGKLLDHLGRRAEALASYRAASRAASRSGDEHLAYQARAALGAALESASPSRALVNYRAAIGHLESLRLRSRADDVKLSFVADKVEVYERAVGLLLRRDTRQRRAEALAMIEQGKAVGLLDDLLARAQRGGRESAALAGRVRDLRASLSEAYSRRDGNGSPPNPSIEATVTRLEREEAAATRDLQLAMRRDTAVAPFELATLQELLPPNAALLEFYSLGSELVCFVVDGDQVRLYRDLGSLAEVAQLADRLRFHFGKGVFGAAYLEAHLLSLRRSLDRVLGDLWQLLAPLLADLDTAAHLVIVPHGPLHGLPLHASFDGRAYLAERWSVSYAPSARAFAACSSRSSEPPQRPLFVGPRDDALPWVAREVATLADLFPQGDSLEGRRATVAALRRRAGRFDLLHLAAHGLFRADNPNFSAIRLSDGWLTVGDLAELSHNASLVTLSACETGLNSVAAGEELVGLTRAVLGAGAASLVASLWTVHDQSTSHFMAEFYGGLVSGESKTASLQRAMWAVRREFDHPHFWAPFVLAGAI